MNRFALLLLTMIILAGLTLPALGQTSVTGESSTVKKPSADPYLMNYRSYSMLLADIVDGSQVDYDSLLVHRSVLDDIIGQQIKLPAENLELLSREGKIAFWINAFNAIVLRSVIDAWPFMSIRQVNGFLETKRWRVAGKHVTLEDIRQVILVKELDEPRAYFVINDATAGAPPLKPIIFTGRNLDKQLDQVITEMINDGHQTVIDHGRREIRLNGIFNWITPILIPKYAKMEKYKQLDKRTATLLNFVWHYANEENRAKLRKHGFWNPVFMEYPFLVNSNRTPPAGASRQMKKPTE